MKSRHGSNDSKTGKRPDDVTKQPAAKIFEKAGRSGLSREEKDRIREQIKTDKGLAQFIESAYLGVLVEPTEEDRKEFEAIYEDVKRGLREKYEQRILKGTTEEAVAAIHEARDNKDALAIPALLGVLKQEGRRSEDISLEDGTISVLACEACEALAAIGDKGDRVVDDLIAIARGPNEDFVEHYIFSLLGELGNTRAVPFLMEEVRDNYPEIIGEAVTALGKLGDRKAIPVLMDLYAKSNSDDGAVELLTPVLLSLGVSQIELDRLVSDARCWEGTSPEGEERRVVVNYANALASGTAQNLISQTERRVVTAISNQEMVEAKRLENELKQIAEKSPSPKIKEAAERKLSDLDHYIDELRDKGYLDVFLDEV